MLMELKGALAHLLTAPSRPRYQSRTMHTAFLVADENGAQADTARHQGTLERIDTLTDNLAACTAGSVQLLRGPIAVVSLVVLAIGATTLMH